MKSFIPKMSKSVTSIVFLSSLFVFQVYPTKAEDPHAEMVWVLTETQVNPYDGQLEFYGGGVTPDWFGETRFKGKFIKYAVTETSFRIDDRDVDDDIEYHNVTIETHFQKPPLRLTPGETIELAISFSHSGTAEDGVPFVQFWYDSEDVDIQPNNVFAYAPWSEGFDGKTDGTYSFEVPPASSGREIEFYAGWWNATPCLVIWKYQAQEVSATAGEEAAPDQDEATNPDSTTSDDHGLPAWVSDRDEYMDVRRHEFYVPEWLDWIRPKTVPMQMQGFIKPHAEGEVWVYSHALKKWLGAVDGVHPLYAGDIVIANADSFASIVLKGKGQVISTTIYDEASIQLPLPESETDYPNLWYLYSGAIKIKRTILGEEFPRDKYGHPPFLITDFIGIVGARSEFVFSHDPETHRSNIYLINGEIDYYNLAAAGPDDAILTAGKKLVVMENGQETVSSFDEAELESILDSNNIEELEPLTPEEIEQLFSKDIDAENEDVSRNRTIILAILGICMCMVMVLGIGVAIVFLVLRAKTKEPHK